MARKYGNTGASSLVRAVEAAADRTANYQDSIASYEFDLSNKDPEDFKKYDAYLTTRFGAVKDRDPAKALSIQKTQTGAYRSFNSAQISRLSMSVAYGDTDNRSKYGQMVGLFQQALANGDDNLAQSIEGQLGRLSITIQNEDRTAAERAQAASDRAGKAGTAAFKAGVTSSKRELSVLEDAIDAAYKTGQPLKNSDGSVIKGRFENGQLIIDPNGKPVRLTDRNYRQGIGTVLANRAEVLKQAIDSGMDENGQYEAELYGLTSGSKFQQFAGKDVLERFNRQGGGEDPYVTEIDPITGERRAVAKKVVSQQSIGQLDGKQVIGNQYETGRQGDKISFYRALGTEQGSPQDDLRLNLLKDDKQRDYYIDPVTGKKILVDKEGVRSLADLPAINATDGNSLGAAMRETYPALGRAILGGIKSFNPLEAVKSGFAAIGNPVGAIRGLLSGDTKSREKAKLQEMARQAEEKRQRDALAAEVSRRQILAQPRPVGAPVKVAPQPVAKKAYLPTPVGQTPAQVFQASIPSDRKPNDQEIARGIGAAAGYNTFNF